MLTIQFWGLYLHHVLWKICVFHGKFHPFTKENGGFTRKKPAIMGIEWDLSPTICYALLCFAMLCLSQKKLRKKMVYLKAINISRSPLSGKPKCKAEHLKAFLHILWFENGFAVSQISLKPLQIPFEAFSRFDWFRMDMFKSNSPFPKMPQKVNNNFLW